MNKKNHFLRSSKESLVLKPFQKKLIVKSFFKEFLRQENTGITKWFFYYKKNKKCEIKIFNKETIPNISKLKNNNKKKINHQHTSKKNDKKNKSDSVITFF